MPQAYQAFFGSPNVSTLNKALSQNPDAVSSLDI
jgi:hypothetical protein